ncbi:MAG: electron transport complex subunit RsxG [Cellvibrionales bacterium]|nr:electron transport complex subunit RsxG [Cellvibrionales bacterium]
MKNYATAALRSATRLGTFALATALILGLTYVQTRDPIAESQRRAAEQALLEVLGTHPFDNDLLTDQLPMSTDLAAALNLDTAAPELRMVRVARLNGEPTGFIFQAVAPDGYSGAIRLLLGIDRNGQLLGVRAVAHRETPGLGDKIDAKKHPWISQFAGLSLQNPPLADWAVKPDGGYFDAFTGATITPRAVVGILRTALQQYAAERDRLLALAHEPREQGNEHGEQLNGNQ